MHHRRHKCGNDNLHTINRHCMCQDRPDVLPTFHPPPLIPSSGILKSTIQAANDGLRTDASSSWIRKALTGRSPSNVLQATYRLVPYRPTKSSLNADALRFREPDSGSVLTDTGSETSPRSDIVAETILPSEPRVTSFIGGLV